MDLTTAVQKHAEWKTKLRCAIAKQGHMNVTTLSRDDCCELGQWLHGEARARAAHPTGLMYIKHQGTSLG